MGNRFFTARRITIAVLCLVVVLGGVVVGGLVILHGHKETAWARAYVRIIPLPAGRVGKTWVLYREYLQHLDAQATFLKGPAAQALGYPTEMTNELRGQSFDRAMRIAAVEESAKESNIQVTSLDVDRSYLSLIQRAEASSTQEEIQSFLKDQFGWNEVDFKNYVVRPAMIEDALRQTMVAAGKSADALDTALEARLSASSTKRFIQF